MPNKYLSSSLIIAVAGFLPMKESLKCEYRESWQGTVLLNKSKRECASVVSRLLICYGDACLKGTFCEWEQSWKMRLYLFMLNLYLQAKQFVCYYNDLGRKGRGFQM